MLEQQSDDVKSLTNFYLFILFFCFFAIYNYSLLHTKETMENPKVECYGNIYLFNENVPIIPTDPNYIFQNQRLAGSANPKTLVPPVIAPHLADLNHWRANNVINHSHINTESHYDTYLSGYEVSKYDSVNSCLQSNKQNEDIISHPETSNKSVTGSGEYQERYTAIKQRGSVEGYQGFTCKEGTNAHDRLGNQHLQHVQENKPVKENFEYPYKKNQYTLNGYNPNQIEKSNLPSNLASSNCESDEAMKQYNKNLFTQTIQPDIYTVNEVIEPINSNMGISFTQQFKPTTSHRDEKDVITYTEHDPYIYKPKMEQNDPNMTITESNIYDPRFSGYGTSYRAYTHKEIGQPRFYYDDVNSIRMPNYVVRSNIDFTNYADNYGPLSDDNKQGNKYNNNIRELANDTFLRSSLQHRDELMERLMRKRNSEMWQLRKYPKHSTG